MRVNNLRSENPCQLFRRCVEEPEANYWDDFLFLFGDQVRQAVLRACARRSSILRRLDLDLDEVMQEVYCQVLAKRGTPFEGDVDEQLWRWVERVAEHLICDFWRRHQAFKRCPPGARVEASEVLCTADVEQTLSSPEHHLLVKEGIGGLLERCRNVLHGVRSETVVTVVRRAFLEGCTTREIAWASDGQLSVREVNALLNRLRRGLAAQGLRLPRRSGAGQQAAWTFCGASAR